MSATLSAKFDISVLPSSIDILNARAQGVRVAIDTGDQDAGSGADAPAMFENLVLPFPLTIEDFRAADVEIDTADFAHFIERVELSAAWHEEVQVHRLVVGTAEVDVEGEATVDLGRDNTITSKLRAALKPALTGVNETLMVQMSTEGDLAGTRVLAKLDTFATVEGSVQWGLEPEAAADITLENLELEKFVANWPAGFPVDGMLHVVLDDVELRLHDSVVEIGNTDGRILVDGGVRLADHFFGARLQWEQLRWPLPESETRVRSERADLRVSGAVDDWKLLETFLRDQADQAELEGNFELLKALFEIDGEGNRNGARGRIVDSEVLGGRIDGEVAYAWSGARSWLARLDLANINLAWMFPDWPAVVSGRLESEGTGKPFAMRAVLEGIEGTLRDEPIAADGLVDIADGNVFVSGLRIDHDSSTA